MKILKRISIASLFLSLLFASTAFAISLDEAKAKGLVGEKLNGYLAPVSASADADVIALVNDINSKRKNEYSKIAKQNGTSIEAVEKLAGGKAISITPAGQYVQSASGEWIKK